MPNLYIPQFHPEKKTQTQVRIIYDSLKHLGEALNDGWELCGNPCWNWNDGEFRVLLRREVEITATGLSISQDGSE